MTNRPFIGLGLALLVECRQWTTLRWDFDHDAYVRAWKITVIATALTGILIYMAGSIYTALPNLLTWLPPLLLPLQFVQSYGMNDSMPISTFSFLAKQRRKRNLRLGLTETIVHIHFGNVFFIAVLLASTLGNRSSGAASWAFLPGIIILTGWMLLAASRSRPLALMIALSFAGCIALAGQALLEEMENWYGGGGRGTSSFSANSVFTMIGRTGRVNQSPDILWRIRPMGDSPPPRLLRTGSYNRYRAGSWETRPLEAKDFVDLPSRIYEGLPYLLLLPATEGPAQLAAVRKSLPRFNLRGAASNEAPFPLPGDATSLRDFELDSVERNAFGTVLMLPKHSVIDGLVLWRGDTNTEDPPLEGMDDNVRNPRDRETLDAIIRQLELDRLPTLEEKLERIRAWFASEFTYSRDLRIEQSPSPDWTTPTAIGIFLEKVRSGHCEYFATATALLLRQAGIPTRYAVGYAVAERDPKRGEYVVRGTHGHAWVRVWDEKAARWIDFDTTPPSWIPAVRHLDTTSQAFDDFVKRTREDFFVWRNRPANRQAVTLIMSAIGLAVAGFIVLRLWKSRRRIEADVWMKGYEGRIVRTPLNALETAASKRLGPRPPGQPFAAWLAGLRATLGDPADLDEAIALHQQLRFDPAPAPQDLADRLTDLARHLEDALRK